MYGLTSTLTTAAQALNADDGAIGITNNNIANINTPGYSRQTVNLSAEALLNGGVLGDNGVSFGGFSSVRDEILQLSINGKTSDAGSLDAQSTAWSPLESAFSSTDSGLGAAFSNFFSNLSGLSTNPTDASARQVAYSAANGLVDAFHQAAASLSSAQSSADLTVAPTVAQINQLSAQIASLNQQLTQVQAGGQDGGTIEDQRDALTTQLANLTGVNSIRTDTTPTLALTNGTALVMGGTAYPLHLAQGTDGRTHIFDGQGNDITLTITGGTLGGALSMRDGTVPGLSSTLDQLATQFSAAVNAAQTQGYDATGSQGQALFSLPGNGTSAAAGLSLAISSASGIAVSSDGSAGSSGNLPNLLAVQTQALPSGQTPTSTYASFVQTIGSASSDATSNLTATNASISQLKAQQSSESGVSIDEETTNLIKYQQAYSAAAQVITTVNTLFSAVLNMSTGV